MNRAQVKWRNRIQVKWLLIRVCTLVIPTSESTAESSWGCLLVGHPWDPFHPCWQPLGPPLSPRRWSGWHGAPPGAELSASSVQKRPRCMSAGSGLHHWYSTEHHLKMKVSIEFEFTRVVPFFISINSKNPPYAFSFNHKQMLFCTSFDGAISVQTADRLHTCDVDGQTAATVSPSSDGNAQGKPRLLLQAHCLLLAGKPTWRIL